MSANSEAKAKMIRFVEGQATEPLIAAMLHLDAKSTGYGYAGLDEAEVMSLLTIGDVLTARHPEADALIDTWMADESPEGLAFIDENSWAALIALAISETSK